MKTVVAGALGECVHVAGVLSFLCLAEAAGWKTVFLWKSPFPLIRHHFGLPTMEASRAGQPFPGRSDSVNRLDDHGLESHPGNSGLFSSP